MHKVVELPKLEINKEIRVGGNGHKLSLRQKIARWLLRNAYIDELHIGAHTITIDGDVIKMNALASDPATPAEGWIWYLAGATHKPRHHDGTSNKDIGEGAAPGAHASTHQNGGADEISVAGLSGELADAQPPKTHNLGGAEHGADTLANLNAKVSDATLDDSSASRTPTAHKASHQSGGADEISVAGLSGVLADAQTPASHDRTKHSDIDQSLLTTDNVTFAQVTVGDLVLKNGYRFTEHKKHGICLKSPKGKLYRLLVEEC